MDEKGAGTGSEGDSRGIEEKRAGRMRREQGVREGEKDEKGKEGKCKGAGNKR